VTWLAWRQFRANAALAAVATVAVALLLVATRDHVAHTPQLSTAYESLKLLGTGLIGVPAFVGAFWGAPLVARELEAGTHRLVWTQSITRGRWLATKLGVAGLVAVVGTAVFSLAFTWWSQPLDRIGNRIGTANFGQRGITPVAYVLFALALGTLAGAVLRRTLPAMAATLAGFFVVRYSFQLFVRRHLLAPVTTTLPNNLFGQRAESGVPAGWILSSRTVDAGGHTVSESSVDGLLARNCGLTRSSGRGDWVRCTDRLGLHDVVTMHPASHFWGLQLAEAACFLALAALLAAACFWWVRHRTA
jgi:hypothetical protein